MKLKVVAILIVTHGAMISIGFALGIYTLPILIAPTAPSLEEVSAISAEAQYTGEFKRELADSDALHWGEGRLSISANSVSFSGELAPGPDYKLYFSPEFIETEADFMKLRNRMALAGDVKTFDNFVVSLPASLEPADFNTVIVWCETFGEFITAAQYRQ